MNWGRAPTTVTVGDRLRGMCGHVPTRGACATFAPLVVAITLALFSARPSSAALPDNLIVERLGEERGFPSGTITALYRDRAGFLWVGSREGLAFWDGYSVRSFEHEVGNPDSLPDNSIRVLYEDRAGRFWVGTNTGGLALLDRAVRMLVAALHPVNPDPADASAHPPPAIASGADPSSPLEVRI